MFWAKESIDQDFMSLPKTRRNWIAAKFVRTLLPGWPAGMSLDIFLMHMTTHYPVLVKTLLVWEKDREKKPGKLAIK